MKIRELLFASALLLTASFCSCNENEVVTPSNGDQTRNIAFSIAIPKGDPVTYADIHHDGPEWTIKSLWIYEFDGSNDPNTAKLLKAPEDIQNKLSGTGPTYEYSRKVTIGDDGMRQFIFVANEAVPAGVTAGTTTLGELKEKLASNTLVGSSKSLLNDFSGEKGIPMTGFAKQGTNTLIAVTGATTITVELERIVARIDVVNKVTNLTVTGLTLRNTNDKSYLFKHKNYEVPASITKVSGINTFADFTPPLNAGTELKKAFYLYEGHQPTEKNKAVHVEIQGELSGTKVVYQIPFWDLKNDVEIPVKRNYAYYITLGENEPLVPGSKIQFTIETAPWNEILMYQPFHIISAKAPTTLPAGVTYDKATHQLSFSKDGYAGEDLTFEFATEFKNHTAFAENVPGTPGWVTADVSGNIVKIKAAANASGKERSAVIEITSDADSTIKYYINVKQAG